MRSLTIEVGQEAVALQVVRPVMRVCKCRNGGFQESKKVKHVCNIVFAYLNLPPYLSSSRKWKTSVLSCYNKFQTDTSSSGQEKSTSSSLYLWVGKNRKDLKTKDWVLERIIERSWGNKLHLILLAKITIEYWLMFYKPSNPNLKPIWSKLLLTYNLKLFLSVSIL